MEANTQPRKSKSALRRNSKRSLPFHSLKNPGWSGIFFQATEWIWCSFPFNSKHAPARLPCNCWPSGDRRETTTSSEAPTFSLPTGGPMRKLPILVWTHAPASTVCLGSAKDGSESSWKWTWISRLCRCRLSCSVCKRALAVSCLSPADDFVSDSIARSSSAMPSESSSKRDCSNALQALIISTLSAKN